MVKKVVVRPGQRLFAWVLKLFGTASALIRGKEDEMERQMGGEEKGENWGKDPYLIFILQLKQ